MTKIGALFPGEFWAGKDGGWPRKFTISHLVESMKVGEDMKPVLFFIGEERGLALGPTTGAQVAEACGTEDYEDWVSREIVVYFDPNIMFGGKRTGGLRVRAPKQQAAKPAAKPVPKQTTVDEDMDDDIPF